MEVVGWLIVLALFALALLIPAKAKQEEKDKWTGSKGE